ncbi:hypothetical protein BAE44_0004673 [Dichanthelium oligosanthes]|uniref:Uncharacterized protein n=1 Tax=Dichanthelium oligosanthes TaxID=888268 RepID=A0A1E5WA55_9POAL|nr:hypothetical protein BAE44_0004673 [Dichanthelium oligosanthes]
MIVGAYKLTHLPMKTKKTMNGSLHNKGKLFDGLIGKDDSEIDPSYKFFLEHLSKDGNTYVLDVPDGDHGMPVSVRYEEDDMSYRNVKGKNSLNGSLRRSCIVPNGKRSDEKAAKAASGNVGRSSSPRRSDVQKKKKKTSQVDESYELFLNLVKFKDGLMVIEPEPGVTIVYEREEDVPAAYDELRSSSSTNEPGPLMSPLENMEEYAMHRYDYGLAPANKIASEHEMDGPSSENMDGQDVICTDERGLVLYTEPSDLNACEDEQATPLAISCSGSSTFDEKLNAVLIQPYDQNEYEELWRKATDRKPVSRQRHLRSSSKRYVTEAIGLSYLDYYPDLALQINSADCDERLSLLRKFFFWLENLCHEGSYMPWISKPLACNPISPDEYEPTPALETRKDEP